MSFRCINYLLSMAILDAILFVNENNMAIQKTILLHTILVTIIGNYFVCDSPFRQIFTLYNICSNYYNIGESHCGN